MLIIINIQSGLRGLAIELAAVESIPRGAPFPCRGGAGGGVSIVIVRRRVWFPLVHRGVEVAMEEECAGGQEVGGYAGGVDHYYSPECSAVAQELGHDSTD